VLSSKYFFILAFLDVWLTFGQNTFARKEHFREKSHQWLVYNEKSKTGNLKIELEKLA